MSCRMPGANMRTAEEKDVLYVFVTFLLQSNEMVSKIDFMLKGVFQLIPLLIFQRLKREGLLDREQLIVR